MTKNKIKKSLSLIAVSAATALSLVVSLLREKWNLKFPEAFIK